MPLKKGGAKAVSANIRELKAHGTKPRSQKQIVAIAINAAKGNKKKR